MGNRARAQWQTESKKRPLRTLVRLRQGRSDMCYLGRKQQMSWKFFSTICDEAYAIVYDRDKFSEKELPNRYRSARPTPRANLGLPLRTARPMSTLRAAFFSRVRTKKAPHFRAIGDFTTTRRSVAHQLEPRRRVPFSLRLWLLSNRLI